VIYIIGDGMGLDHVAAGQMMNQKHYGFTDWQFTTANTDSVGSDGYGPVTTDSAASGTALATGTLTVNGYIGKDHTGADVTTILDYAKGLGKATGVLTTDTLTGATPSAFSAHNISRNNAAEIAASQLDSGVDLLGGHTANETANKAAAEAHGYAYCDDFSKIDGVMTSEKTYWQLDLGGTGAEVSLADATKKALAFLERDEDGFALMIEQAHVDKYAHSNDIRGAAESVDSLNDTVEAILAWLGDRTDTMIVITSDHETGGLSVSYEKRYSKSVNSFVTDASGNRVRVYYHFASTGHTNAKVGVFVYGVEVDFKKLSYYGVENTIKNIDIYDMLVDVLTPEQPAA
jgi:alkaline phosphatase